MPTINNAVNAQIQGLQNFNASTGAWTGRTLTAGTGISISNGDGTSGNPVISATGGAETWSDKATSFAAVSNNGYFCTATLTATLPASPTNGDEISIYVDASATITITANTGQTLHVGSVVSASAGTAVNTLAGDAMTLVYRSTNTQWVALNFVGNWTVT